MDNLELKKLERDLVDGQVSLILLNLVGEVINSFSGGPMPNVEPYARKIVAHCREHIVN